MAFCFTMVAIKRKNSKNTAVLRPTCVPKRLHQEQEDLKQARLVSELERSGHKDWISSEPGLRGELLVSGALRFPIKRDSLAVWSAAT